MPTPPPAEQFWLLTGEVPSGPFTVAQVHAELAAGRANWQTPACPVGGAVWLPLVRTPGIGPTAGPDAARPEISPGASAAEPLDPPVEAKPDGRFWLLVGTETTGPFRPSEIRYKLQTGELSPDAKARRVGTEVWIPLTEAVGALPPRPPAIPKASPAADTAPAGTAAATPPAPPAGSSASPSTPEGKAELVGAAIGIGIILLLIAGVGYGAYWAYEQIRPYTATEVCKKLDEVKTAAEARKYTTSRMHPFVDASYADKSARDPNMTFEWTEEVDGPQANTKLVGFRGSMFVTEAGQRVRMEGHCRVVRADGWKVDDMIVTGVEGASHPGPVSLVDEHRRSATAPKAPGTAPSWTSPSKSAPKPPTPETVAGRKHPVEAVFLWFKERIGWGGIVVVIVLVIIGAVIRESYEKKKAKS